MRLSYYECTELDCKARFLGRTDMPNEHHGVRAKHLVKHAESCEDIEVVQFEKKKGEGHQVVSRGFWKSNPGEKVAPSILLKQFSDHASSPRIHVHRCTNQATHTEPHFCTCDYTWEVK